MFEWLLERVERAGKVFDQFGLDYKIILNPPISEREIEACEAELNVPLPRSYREFLLQWNGACLFCDSVHNLPDKAWSDFSGLLIYGTRDLVELNLRAKEGFAEEKVRELLFFCCSLGSNQYCGFDLQKLVDSEYAVLDCCSDFLPEEWYQEPIAPSFVEWLTKIFDNVVLHKKIPEYWYGEYLIATEAPYALVVQGRQKAHVGDYQGALLNFDRALQLEPDSAEAYHERGNVLMALADYQEAIESYSQAIHLGHNYVATYNGCGLARFELGDYTGAIEDFNRSMEDNPTVAQTYRYRGDAQLRLGDYQGAEADYQKAAQLVQRLEQLQLEQVEYGIREEYGATSPVWEE